MLDTNGVKSLIKYKINSFAPYYTYLYKIFFMRSIICVSLCFVFVWVKQKSKQRLTQPSPVLEAMLDTNGVRSN